ncbi:hypothetical protein [Skermanella sp. TT6]|uniref:hypothetical protein n=1 Tax=Skermanella cutis TaxID=2775420 RepID=UPI001FFF003A|nr:hypothetical protein [Skermanella sp. TT6]
MLRLAGLVGDRLILSYMVDAKTGVERFKLDGTPDGAVELPGIGSAGAFHGRPGDDETFFVFTSQDAPTSIYRYDVQTNTSTVWAAPEVATDLDRIIVEQRFHASRDGTRVPVFVVLRSDVTGPAPTMLTANGGFGFRWFHSIRRPRWPGSNRAVSMPSPTSGAMASMAGPGMTAGGDTPNRTASTISSPRRSF